MAEIKELLKEIKTWERGFQVEKGRKPTATEIRSIDTIYHKYKRYRQLKAAALSHKPKQPPQSDPQFPTRSLTSTPSAVRNGRRRSAEGSDGTPRSSSIRYDIFSLSESVSEPQRRTEQPLIRPINPPELRLSFAVAQHYNTKQDDYHEWMEEGVDEVRGIRRRSAIEEVTKELLQGPLQSGCDDCAPIAQQDGEDSSDDESDATPPSSPITFVDVEDDRWHEASPIPPNKRLFSKRKRPFPLGADDTPVDAQQIGGGCDVPSPRPLQECRMHRSQTKRPRRIIDAPSKTDLHTLSLGKGKRTNYRRMKTKGAVRKVGNRFVSVNKQFRPHQRRTTTMEDLDDSFLAESAGSTSFLSLNNDTVGTTLSQRIEGDTEEVLHSVFGHRSFRCGQRDVINRILNGESTLFVTSTGSGKSLCYQLPACMLPRHQNTVVLVITPLISLMMDQLRSLPKMLNGGSLCSSQSRAETEEVFRLLSEGKIQVLFVSPERFLSERFMRAFLDDGAPNISFACIDEAHCVSEWSHNFRPTYLMLSRHLRDILKVKCILGLTATCSAFMEDSICSILGIPPQNVLRFSPIRSNLMLRCSREKQSQKYAAVFQMLKEEPFSRFRSIIIYCGQRRETEELARCLRSEGIDADFYHARRTPEQSDRALIQELPNHEQLTTHLTICAQRSQVQDRFFRNALRVVTATVAFGLGLNKSDIRAVIHFTLPRSVESYVQEIGRAGRDGEPSYCHLFLNDDDYMLQRSFSFSDGVSRACLKRFIQIVYAPVLQERGSATRHGRNRQEKGLLHAVPVETTSKDTDLKPEVMETLLTQLSIDKMASIELLGPPRDCGVAVSFLCDDDKIEQNAVLKALNNHAKKLKRPQTHSFSVSCNLCTVCNEVDGDLDSVVAELELLADEGLVAYELCHRSFLLRIDDCPEYVEAIVETAYAKTQGMEQLKVKRCDAMYAIAEKSAFDGWKMAWTADPTQCDGERDLNHQLAAYFVADKISVDIPYSPVRRKEDPRSSHKEDDLRRTLHDFLSTAQGVSSGRAAARILHGLSSPKFPSEEWSRHGQVWGRYRNVDFAWLEELANRELLSLLRCDDTSASSEKGKTETLDAN